MLADVVHGLHWDPMTTADGIVGTAREAEANVALTRRGDLRDTVP